MGRKASFGRPATTPPGRAESPRTAACRGSCGLGRRLRRAGFAYGRRRQRQLRQRSGRGFLACPYFRDLHLPLLHWGVLGFGRPPPLHANAFLVGVGTCSQQAVALTSLWRGAGALLGGGGPAEPQAPEEFRVPASERHSFCPSWHAVLSPPLSRKPRRPGHFCIWPLWGLLYLFLLWSGRTRRRSDWEHTMDSRNPLFPSRPPTPSAR